MSAGERSVLGKRSASKRRSGGELYFVAFALIKATLADDALRAAKPFPTVKRGEARKASTRDGENRRRPRSRRRHVAALARRDNRANRRRPGDIRSCKFARTIGCDDEPLEHDDDESLEHDVEERRANADGDVDDDVKQRAVAEDDIERWRDVERRQDEGGEAGEVDRSAHASTVAAPKRRKSVAEDDDDDIGDNKQQQQKLDLERVDEAVSTRARATSSNSRTRKARRCKKHERILGNEKAAAAGRARATAATAARQPSR